MLVTTRFSMRTRTATHSLAILSIIACIDSGPTSGLDLIVYATNRLVKKEPRSLQKESESGRGLVGKSVYLNTICAARLSSPKQESPSAGTPKGLFRVKVGVTGFEPATFCTPCRRASQITLHPGVFSTVN